MPLLPQKQDQPIHNLSECESRTLTSDSKTSYKKQN